MTVVEGSSGSTGSARAAVNIPRLRQTFSHTISGLGTHPVFPEAVDWNAIGLHTAGIVCP